MCIDKKSDIESNGVTVMDRKLRNSEFRNSLISSNLEQTLKKNKVLIANELYTPFLLEKSKEFRNYFIEKNTTFNKTKYYAKLGKIENLQKKIQNKSKSKNKLENLKGSSKILLS